MGCYSGIDFSWNCRLFLAHKINQDFHKVQKSIGQLALNAEKITQGDFNKRLILESYGETRPIAEVFNAFVAKLSDVVKRVDYAANNVIQAADRLKQSSASIADSVSDVECRLGLTSTSSEYIAFNANAMAASIAEASQASKSPVGALEEEAVGVKKVAHSRVNSLYFRNDDSENYQQSS